MILNVRNERVSPKRKAAEILIIAMTNTAFNELKMDENDMTDRERQAVVDQMERFKERVEKVLGYEPGSWEWG